MSDYSLENRLLRYVLVDDIDGAASILCHMAEIGHILGDLPTSLLCRVKTAHMLRLLVSHGVRPDVATIHGETALMYFATREHFNRALVLELLACKANINRRSLNTRDTALIIAVRDHNHDMADILVSAGAKLHLRNQLGLCVFDVAFIFGNHEFRRNFCHLQ